MALDLFSGTISVPTREEIRQRVLRDYKLRNNTQEAKPGTWPDVFASLLADNSMPLYKLALDLGNACTLDGKIGDALDTEGGTSIPRPTAVGASGNVTIKAGAYGTTLGLYDELIEPVTRLRFKTIVAGTYQNNDVVPVTAIDVGPSTNLIAGKRLQWVTPRAGCSTDCWVTAQSDGSGLTGGRLAMQDDEYRDLIRSVRSSGGRGGTSAQYLDELRKVPGMQVAQAFVYPAPFGPGTVCWTVLLGTGTATDSRLPTSAHITLATAHLQSVFPGDDNQFGALVNPVPTDLEFTVKWVTADAGWIDIAPWPDWYPETGAHQKVVVLSAASATSFVLTAVGFATMVPPAAGQSIAFWDSTKATFVRKVIGSVATTGSGWTITVDTTGGLSDTTYVPVVGQRACPWAGGLNDVGAAVLAHFAKLGPGELTKPWATWQSGGLRMMRDPSPAKSWPCDLSSRLLTDLLEVPSVQNATPMVALTATPGDGTPSLVNLLTLDDLTVFATVGT